MNIVTTARNATTIAIALAPVFSAFKTHGFSAAALREIQVAYSGIIPETGEVKLQDAKGLWSLLGAGVFHKASGFLLKRVRLRL